jgi:hypothetical protein
MAGTHEVIQPLRHNGKLHDRGTTVKLSESDGAQLTKFGVVKPIRVTDSEEAKAADLESLTKQQLIDHALVTHNLTLNAASTKAELISAIAAAEAEATAKAAD